MAGTNEDPWYKPEFLGSPQALPLGHLEYLKRRAEDDPSVASRHPGQRWVLGHAIPPFQRPLVWTTGQKVRFLESAARGLHLGTWVFNRADHVPYERVGDREYAHRTDMWLIDGQQRFDALDEFWDDGFPVFGRLWSEVGTVDRRRFLNQTFPATQLAMTDEMELRRLYDRLNFGGTPHKPSERALPDGPGEDEEPAAAPGMR